MDLSLLNAGMVKLKGAQDRIPIPGTIAGNDVTTSLVNEIAQVREISGYNGTETPPTYGSW